MSNTIDNAASGFVVPTSIETEMKHAYLDYAMSVIIGRALPDVRDGLKPVHRRILYAMHELKNTANAPYKKSARVVGDVIGKYHPHGDAAVYDTLVRMAQDFSMGEVLVDGQGNFGSVDGDPPAAMRYTEVRMARLTAELLKDIEKNTVNFTDNYDGSLREPVLLPAGFPNLLVNGASGIAVGMATNIPPHNLAEIIDAAVALAKNPDIPLEELMALVPGPDFPTGGIICGRGGIYSAYKTGKGGIVVRGRTVVEEDEDKGVERLVIHELPYQVNKARLIEKIAELVKEKRITGIAGIRDESDRSGMRVVIDIKKDASAQVVENLLYKMTPLQSSFGIHTLAILNGRPHTFSLKGALQAFLDFREEVVRRRCLFELSKASARLHILEGLQIALDHIDEVVALIRGSKDPETAKVGLMENFSLTEIQAKEILAMRLQRLTGLERDKILAEMAQLREEIARLEELLSNRDKLIDLIVSEMRAIKDAFGRPRRTEIRDDYADLDIEDLIAEEDMVVTITSRGYIKRTPTWEYRAQNRGGRGLANMSTRDDDFVSSLFVASTHSHVLFLSDKGKAYCKKVYQIPPGSRTSRGKAIVNFVGMEPDERVAAVVPVASFDEDAFLLTVTKRGYVKKTPLTAYSNIRQNGIIAVVIEDDDALVGAAVLRPGDHVLLGTRSGYVVRFEGHSQVRMSGRKSRGVRGIKVRRADGPDDEVVSMAVLAPDAQEMLLTITQKGYGKRTAPEEYRVQHRSGMGIRTFKRTEKTGDVVAVLPVREDEHLMLMTSGGKIIRIAASSVRVCSRAAQGVRLMRVDAAEEIIGVERLAEDDSTEEEPAAQGGSDGGAPAADGEDPAGDLSAEAKDLPEEADDLPSEVE